MKAKCIYYGKCSGCTLQQFPYVKQLNDKTRAVRNTLGGLLPKGASPEQLIQPLVPSPAEFGYRTSAKLCLGEDELGRRSIGLYERQSKRIVDIPQCAVHHPEINRMVQRLFGFGKTLPAPFYQHQKKAFQAGRLKFVVLRYCPDTRAFGLVISHTGVDRAALANWAAQLNVGSIYESELKPEDNDLVMSRQVRHLAGPETFRFAVNGLEFAIDPLAFFQANFSLVQTFIDSIAAPHAGRELIDFYGGFGTYSFAAQSRFARVQLVEANPHAIRSAEDQLARTGLKHIETTALSVEDFLRKKTSPEARAKVTDIIVNPPRTGLSQQVVKALASGLYSGLERLSYVSCDLTTLKRDLKGLLAEGRLAITDVIPFDMFPQTEHVETLVRLKVVPGAQAGLRNTQRSPRTPTTPKAGGASRSAKPRAPMSQSQRNSRQTKGRFS